MEYHECLRIVKIPELGVINQRYFEYLQFKTFCVFWQDIYNKGF